MPRGPGQPLTVTRALSPKSPPPAPRSTPPHTPNPGGQVDRCREWCPPLVWPTSWDGYLFRPPPRGALPPPRHAPLHFPMNVTNAVASPLSSTPQLHP